MGHLGRQRVQEAAKLAGIDPVRLLSEPVAAALAFALDNPATSVLCVVDVGGGTTDVSVVQLEERDGEVLANYGDLHLGGRDFDVEIVEFWRKKWQETFGEDPCQDPAVLADWLERAERAKKELSSAEETTAYLSASGRTLSPKLTRTDFERLIAGHLRRVESCVIEALRRASISPADIEHVILVGGSIRVPAIRSLVSRIFGREIGHSVDPTTAVVQGAAIAAADIDGIALRDRHGRRFLKAVLTDVASHGLGVVAVDEDGTEYNHALIKAGTPLPARGSAVFLPLHDDAEAVELTIVEGDDPDLSRCTILQRGYMLKIPVPRKRELVEIAVELVINTDGIVEIHARESGGGEFHEQFRHPAIVAEGGRNGIPQE
jgi:molecular chaperone DnaK